MDQHGELADDDHPEVRLERGKGIIGNLGPRRGNARNQRGLADIGISDQSHIGQKLQLKPKHALFASAAGFVLARRLVR